MVRHPCPFMIDVPNAAAARVKHSWGAFGMIRCFKFRRLDVALVAVCHAATFAQPRIPGSFVRTERAFPSGERGSSALLLERFTPAEVRLSSEFQYELRLTNLTRGRIDDILLVEQMPPGFVVRGI